MTEKKKYVRKPVEREEPLNSNLMLSKRQCPAMSKRTGERCKRYCALGARTCVWHGSATRKSKTAAAKRIAEASGYAADLLVELMADPKVDIKQRTQIAQDLLSRAGYNGKTELVVEVPAWERHMDAVIRDVEVIVDYEVGDDSNVEDAVVVLDAEAEEPDTTDSPAERVRKFRRKAAALPPVQPEEPDEEEVARLRKAKELAQLTPKQRRARYEAELLRRL